MSENNNDILATAIPFINSKDIITKSHTVETTVEDNGIYIKETWGNISSKKLIISKDVFIEAFNKYINPNDTMKK